MNASSLQISVVAVDLRDYIIIEQHTRFSHFHNTISKTLRLN